MKLMKTKVILGVGSLLTALTIFMTQQQYKTSPFDSSELEAEGFFEGEEKGIALSYKVYNAEDSKKYLGRDLLSRGYQPIQITIQNNSAKTFDLSEKGVSLESVAPNKVVRSVMKSSIARSVGFKVAGLFFWPLTIPGTIDGIKTIHGHTKLRRDFNAKVIKEETIAPFTTLYRIVFVPKDKYQENFSVTLSEQGRQAKDNEELVFKSNGKGYLTTEEPTHTDQAEASTELTETSTTDEESSNSPLDAHLKISE